MNEALSISLIIAITLAVVLLIVSRRRRSGVPAPVLIASDLGRHAATVPPLHLSDPRHHVHGTPDLLFQITDPEQQRRQYIPVEYKPHRVSRRLYESDELQLVTYLFCVQAHYGEEAAPFGFVWYRDRSFRVELTPERTARCLAVANDVRAARTADTVARSHTSRAKCTSCGVRDRCDQALSRQHRGARWDYVTAVSTRQHRALAAPCAASRRRFGFAFKVGFGQQLPYRERQGVRHPIQQFDRGVALSVL
jgi:CRISPR/Cas system-associated exonuclease Cas4 (RecB family)